MEVTLTLNCGVTDCKEQVVDTDKKVAIVTFKAHTIDTSYQGSDTDKSASMARPRVTQGMSTESWRSFLALWRLYKTDTEVSEVE